MDKGRKYVMGIEEFGSDGRGNTVSLITIRNQNGTEAKITNLGATLVAFLFQDKGGVKRDVVLGYDSPREYLSHGCYFGATVGRCANRIKDARFTLNGKAYLLEKNDRENNLHSGKNGVSYKIWEIEEAREDSVVLSCESPDREQGFPGNMSVKLTYALDGEDALSITYTAVSDQDTVANFTNHSYFNLNGHDSGAVDGTFLKIYGDQYTPVGKNLIPTGNTLPVEGTPMDFREYKQIGRDRDCGFEEFAYTGAYDHNYVLRHPHTGLRIMAEAYSRESGIHLSAYTDCPGVQFYSANGMEEQKGKEGAVYGPRHGFCLESQYFPDSVNQPQFDQPFLKAGERYHSRTVYRLSLLKSF